MKRRTKFLLGFFVIVVAVFLVFGLPVVQQFRQLAPLDTGEIIPGVFAVRDNNANMYIIRTAENNYIAIDAGGETETVYQEMSTLGINPSDVVAVFVTHADADHVGGLPLFYNATIYLHEEEMQMIDGTTRRNLFIGHNSLPDGVFATAITETVVIAGMEIHSYLVPGHTPGSTFWRIENMLFTGDTIGLRDGRAYVHFPTLFNMDGDEQTESVNALFDQIDFFSENPQVVYLFTSHHGYTNDAAYALYEGLQR